MANGDWGQPCNNGTCNGGLSCIDGAICCTTVGAIVPLSGGQGCCAADANKNQCAAALCGTTQCLSACHNGVCCDTYQAGCDGTPCEGGTWTNGVCCSNYPGEGYCKATNACCFGECCGDGTNLCCTYGRSCAPDGSAICGEMCNDGTFCPGDMRCCGKDGYYQCYDPDNCICYEGRPACG